VGTFGHSYDLLTTIRAARKLGERNINDIHFVLAGDGIFSNLLRKESANLENVSLTGWLNKYEIELLLKASDVGLVAYKENASQSLSYKPFEYLAFGLPLLSSLKGELSQLIRTYEIGVTYKAENEDDFIKWVLEITKNKFWKTKLASNAMHTFQTVLSSDIIYNAYADHIEQIYEKNAIPASTPGGLL
jgi:glycosyltransferase involved in cell wall biosynthesis